jgi:hypothetical protein
VEQTSLEGTATLIKGRFQANYIHERNLVLLKSWCTFTRFKSCGILNILLQISEFDLVYTGMLLHRLIMDSNLLVHVLPNVCNLCPLLRKASIRKYKFLPKMVQFDTISEISISQHVPIENSILLG